MVFRSRPGPGSGKKVCVSQKSHQSFRRIIQSDYRQSRKFCFASPSAGSSLDSFANFCKLYKRDGTTPHLELACLLWIAGAVSTELTTWHLPLSEMLRDVGHADPIALRPCGHLSSSEMLQDVCGSTAHLGKGTAARPRCIPPANGTIQGIEPHIAPRDRIVGQSLAREPSALPCTPSTLSGRPWGYHAPWNHSQGLEMCLSTCAEPCTNGCPFDHQSGERSCSHRYPHDHFMETTSSRLGRKHFIAALALEPSHRSWCVPAPVGPHQLAWIGGGQQRIGADIVRAFPH